jgi:hypothetical protein
MLLLLVAGDAYGDEPTGTDEPTVTPTGFLVTIDPERPVRPSELPPDTIPELEPTGTPVKPKPTSRSVAGAPLPDRAHGMSRAEPSRDGWRLVGRGLLFFPRVALEVVNAPVRGALWSYDRYQLGPRAKDIFFNDAGTVGLYPVANFESGFGITGGARFIARDLFGERESFSMRASFGGLYNQQYVASATTGDRLGPLKLSTDGEYEIEPRQRFFGVGNGDEVDELAMPVDPYTDPAAIDSRFRQRTGRVLGKARLKIAGPLSTRFTSGLLWKRFEQSSPGDIPPGTDIAEHYLTDELPAWEDGTSYSYNELELRYDSRRESSDWERPSIPSTGWLILGYGGLARGFAGAPTRYARYGGDVQRYFRLGESPRVLVLRVLAEEVRGAEDEIPFVDLPRLGGPTLLRGYTRDRFRDRAMALGSAEYQFDLGPLLSGFLFVDGGRVFPTLADVTAEGIRVGYGGGLQMQTIKSFVGRFNVASSVDGGIFLNLSFDPVYDPHARVERD